MNNQRNGQGQSKDKKNFSRYKKDKPYANDKSSYGKDKSYAKDRPSYGKDKSYAKDKLSYGKEKSYAKDKPYTKPRKENVYKKDNSFFEDTEKRDDLIFGRNPVMEALKSGHTINKIMVAIGATGSVIPIVTLARSQKIIVQEVSTNVLDKIANGENHQGIIAMIAPFGYASVDDILNKAKEKNEKAFIIIVDGVTDPHNLGALIRTAECVGAHGLIIPKRNAVPVNSTVAKVAAGGAEYMLVARENNITQTVEYLKKKGVWIFAAEANGQTSLYETKLDDNVAIIIGGEDTGVRKNVIENCDVTMNIPIVGKITSLNASVAGAVIMYEVLRQRMLGK